MNSKRTRQTANLKEKPNDGVQLNPELLMAARLGDRERLRYLLSTVTMPPAALPQGEVVIRVDEDVGSSVSTVDGSDDDTKGSRSVTSAEAVTITWDSVLHVVACSGENAEFTDSAMVIYGMASHLLNAGNKKGDTPLHCAARAGRVGMVCCLLDLARGKDNGDAAAKLVVRRQNNKGETALHEAVRLKSKKMVQVLMSVDPELARVVPADGDSPLYLAVSLGRRDIARMLHKRDEALSYAGPDGKNALHAAVQIGKEMTAMILDWKKDLTKLADRSKGRTALHVAASWGYHDIISLLLDVDSSAVYRPDHDGSFPIHVAAFDDQVKAVSALLDIKRGHGYQGDCAELRDGRGRSFLHVAVLEECWSVVAYACNQAKLEPTVMNMQDDDGDTALHLAVQVGNLWIFNLLMQRRHVELNLTNSNGKTLLDLSGIKKPVGLYYGLNTHIRINNMLRDAGARVGSHRWDDFDDPRGDHFRESKRLVEKEEAKRITSATKTIGVGSVLIATVSFAAAFTLPGGYLGDGTPTLAGKYAFDVFVIANSLAMICAGLSIVSLIYAGLTNDVDLRIRMISIFYSQFLMTSSARCVVVAFAFGMYMVLAPVSHATAIAACAIMSLALVDIVWYLWVVAKCEVVLLRRFGVVWGWWRLPRAILVILLTQLWPYVVIAGVVSYTKMKRVH